ncbi:MAG: helix-turn-helix domain-containing protein [Candidatus Thiodiazotropha sp.]
MSPRTTSIALLTSARAMQTAVHGLSEMFGLANRLCHESEVDHCFSICQFDIQDMPEPGDDGPGFAAVLIPPLLDDSPELPVDPRLLSWLRNQHARGALLCSVCAGAFILAQTGLLDHRPVTTHWMLGERLQQCYPAIDLKSERMLICDSEIITAGGLMAWIDLGLELVARYAGPGVVRELGRLLVIDTGGREQRYYRRFLPRLDHGDAAVLKAQQLLHAGYAEPVPVTVLARAVHLTERTLLRRFVKATGLRPHEYLQRLRVDRVCDRLEETRNSFESIAASVGYRDASACRKTFIKVTGLTPAAYRRRFAPPDLKAGARSVAFPVDP